ncbi:MAG TPA: GspH/FimT family pseudopilin [Candidatus Omnitrophota bacterium]|nr:GspH/FimT family pseudopilin [Candidatus Omnitrophota bacterium]
MKRRNGLTLLELMIVLSIVALLSFASFVFIGFMNGVKVQSAADKLAGDLRYARNQAMAKTQWYGVSFETTTDKYYVYQTGGGIDTIETDPADFTKTMIVNVADRFNVDLVAVTVEGGQKKVEFNGLGQPYTDYPNWAISSEATILLGIGSQTKTVAVTPGTGRVDVR